MNVRYIAPPSTFATCLGPPGPPGPTGPQGPAGSSGLTPTGTGFAHVTSGTLDAASKLVKLFADTRNDIPVNGFPFYLSSVDPTNPGVLADFGPVTLSGGSDYVVGKLPLGNQAAPTGTGFPHITGATWDGASRAVNLASADVSGALPITSTANVTGQPAGFIFYDSGVNGGAPLSVGTISLNTAGYVSGLLPLTNQAAPTGTGFVKVLSGGWVTAAASIALGDVAAPTGTGIAHVVSGVTQATATLLVNADVSATAAIASSKLDLSAIAQSVNFGVGSAFSCQVAAGFTSTVLIRPTSTNNLRYQISGTQAGFIAPLADAGVTTLHVSGMDAFSSATVNLGGGDALLHGGARATTAGLRGRAGLIINGSAATEYAVEAGDVQAAATSPSRFVALNVGARMTNAKMPTGTGDLVTYIGNCAVAPTVNPVGGVLLYAEAGILKCRTPAGTVAILATP